MIGYNNLEGMHWDIYNLLCKGQSEFLTDFSTVIPNNVHCTKGSLYCKTLEDKIKSTYFGYTKDDPCVWDKMGLFNLYTDVFWLRGIYSTIRNHLATSACPVYFYRFAVDSGLNISKCLSAPFKANCSYRGIVHTQIKNFWDSSDIITGASNGDELCYLFRFFKDYELPQRSYEDSGSERIVQLWTNFAYYGNPTEKRNKYISERWEPTNPKDIFCMDIEDCLGINLEPAIDKMKFWDVVYGNDCRTRKL